MSVYSLNVPVRVTALAAALTLSLAAGALAAGKHAGGHGHGTPIGMPGKAANVTRTVTVVMTDNRYEPASISLKKGETVRFKVVNKGEFVHEFNIATAEMHAAHQKDMMMMVEHGVLGPDKINHHMMKSGHMMGGKMMMQHDDPNSVLLEPGKSAELIWKFDADARLEFACNVPGHYDSGMVGKISITK